MNMRCLSVVWMCILAVALVGFSCGGGSKSETKKSSIEGTIDGQKISNENDEAIPNQFSAQISGNTIAIYLMPTATSLIHIVGETDDAHKLPGKLKIVEATYTDGTTIYVYESGTVSLDSCPSAVGDTFTGKLTGLALTDQMSGTKKNITADFSVTVVNVANPALVCGGGGDTTVACGYSADECEGGVCCPYVECFNACFFKDCLATCADPNKMMECLSCMGTCDSNCQPKMTSACQTAFEALNTCMDEHGCDNLVDDAEIACARTYCCNELKAAFQK